MTTKRKPLSGARRLLNGLVLMATLAWSLVPCDRRVAMQAGGLQGVTPPGQPSMGPGGRAYRFGEIERVRAGASPSGAWVFFPGDANVRERRELPVVIFLHGFGATDPVTYRDWIDHLVRRGSTVIYPDYQDAGFSPRHQETYLDNMLTGVAAGLAELGASPDHVHVVGHSLGAVLAVVFGVFAPAAHLPRAATLTLIEPGGCRNCGTFGEFGVALPLNRSVPEGTLVRTVVGSDDAFVGDADARAIQPLVAGLPVEQRVFESVRGDDHGSPALVADHLFPQTGRAGGETDALDWLGLWRPFDALMTCADVHEDCDIALGTGDQHRFMGLWSDGTPVRSPVPVT